MTKIAGSGSGSTPKCHGSATLLGGSVPRPVVADSHHFNEEEDPDPHKSEMPDPDPH
jgi:hypothetical protein